MSALISSTPFQKRLGLTENGIYGNGRKVWGIAAIKIIYLALLKAQEKWKMPISDWKAAINQFAIIFGDRFPDQGM